MENPYIYQGIGVIVVFSCLIALSLMLAFSGKIATWFNNKAKTAAKPAQQTVAKPQQQAQATQAVANNELTPELIAAISAAVHTVLGGRAHKIINIKQSANSAYSMSGRSEIFASHRIRPGHRG